MVMTDMDAVEAYVRKVWSEEHRSCGEGEIAEALGMSEPAILDALLTLERLGRLKPVG